MIKFANRFVLEQELGSGGMSRVYLGHDEVLDRSVAVKVLNPVHGGTDIGNRFEREGRTAARLVHPYVVQVYDAGEASFGGRETSYIVMEYVTGGDLKALIDRRGRLSGPELARLGDEVCAGLAHAHDRGVIHRDIKPHNILLDENGHAKVTDFGIARALDASQATRTGSFLGTALYSSPEQLQGQKVTPKSDVYSFGATLYQAATGEPPFSGSTPIEIASQHVSKTPVPPRKLGADVSEGLQALILDCLAKHPEDRPTVEEIRFRLDAEIPAAGATQPQSAASPPTRAAEQTRDASAAPSPGAKPGGAMRRESRGRRGGILVVLAILAVVVVIGALAAPGLFGGNGGEDAGSNNAGRNNAQVEDNEGRSGGQPGGGSGSDQGPGANASPSPTASASVGPAASSEGSSSPASSQNVPERGVFTAQAAEDTVQAFYSMTSDGEYDRSAELLSEDWRRSTFPNRSIFEGTFGKVERVEFIVGPNAEVSGDTATVTGETRATLTGEIQHNKGTWYLVHEDDRWKIDNWDVVELSSQPA